MALNLDNLIVDRAISGSMFNRATGELFYSMNQITEPSLECGGETVYTVDAVGANVAGFDRSKTASLSGANAFINLGLAAAQFGSNKVVATDTETIIVPVREVGEVVDGKITLKQTPAEGHVPTYITKMTTDGGMAESYPVADTASTTEFAITGKEITVPTGVAAGDRFVILYSTESSNAVQIENKADCFSKGGEFWLEVLFADICDPNNTKYHGYIVFPNAKMSNETTIDFNNEATHGFTIEAMQDYCDADKKLFRMVVYKD